MKFTTKKICITALGVAFYVSLSMAVKIPIPVGHLALDLGYIVLANYCYFFGPYVGMVVGGAGCVLVSLLVSGWFPAGWLLGNILIGAVCGLFYRRDKTLWNVVVSVVAVLLGILGVKTLVECVLYDIPLVVKLPKNTVAAVMDAAVMALSPLVWRKLRKERDETWRTY